MPKLLSRSKHEEFKSNSALQIKDQKERREENTKKMEHYRNAFLASTMHPASTVPPAACSPAFHTSVFLLYFFCFFLFNPCNSFCFGFFFCNFIYTEHLYKPQFVQTELHFTSAIESGSFPAASFLHFLSFSFPFLGCQTLL